MNLPVDCLNKIQKLLKPVHRMLTYRKASQWLLYNEEIPVFITDSSFPPKATFLSSVAGEKILITLPSFPGVVIEKNITTQACHYPERHTHR